MLFRSLAAGALNLRRAIHGHKEFLMKLDHAVTQVSDESAAARRRTRVALESWDNRLGSLLGHVQRTLDIKNSVADR